MISLDRKKRVYLACLIVSVFFIISVCIHMYIRLYRVMDDLDNGANTYIQHYAFIAESDQLTLWNAVYQGAKEQGDELGIAVEWIGTNLANKYHKEDLLKIAIESDVDGIILEGGSDAEIDLLIDEALSRGIPVVTVIRDSYTSNRCSHIGIGQYELGREYGREIIRISPKDYKTVLVLTDTDDEDVGKNLIISGIRETLFNEGNHLNLDIETVSIDNNSPFSTEEAIKNILRQDPLPDILICLNEINTIYAYQAVVDYNMVGWIQILGYYNSDTILNAVDKNIITSTIAVDSNTIGRNSVMALKEYIDTGYVNDFISIDPRTITDKNVGELLRDARI